MLRWALGATAVAATTVTLAATVTMPLEFRQIVTLSSVIVEGHVTDVRSVMLSTRDVESVATVAVDLAFRGTTDPFVYVHVPGGQVGNLHVTAVDAPQFTVKERGVFFLRRGPDDALRPVGLSLGVFRIALDANSGQAQVDPPLLAGQTAAIGPVVHGDPTRRVMSLSDFESIVRLVMAGQAVQPGGGSR